jgi:class 3 adenylate cyclase
VQRVVADPSLLHLGGSRQNMTVIFTDIQKSTSIAEKLEPENLVALLNRYLTGMSDILIEQGGIIDKYAGDTIVSFFGAPSIQPDHASLFAVGLIPLQGGEVHHIMLQITTLTFMSIVSCMDFVRMK